MPDSTQTEPLAPDIPAAAIVRDRLRRVTAEAGLLRKQLRLAERREREQEKLLSRREGHHAG